MSDLFDDAPRATPPAAQPSRRSRALVVTAVVLVMSFFAVTAFAALYTDRLWFRSVGYGQVFSTMLWTRVLLFLGFGLVMAAVVGLNMHLAYRYRPLFRAPGADNGLDRYREAVTPVRTWLMVGVAAVVGGFAGTSAMGQWRNLLLWRNSQPFGTEDVYFQRDIGFYIFSLPWFHYLVDFMMAVAVISIFAAAVVHYLFGGIRLQVRQDRLSGAAQVQLSVLLGVFVVAKAVDYYLDRFDLVLQDNSLFTGMNYTAHNALLPSKNILLGVALICGVLFFLNAWRRTWQLPSVGLALLVLSSILLGMIWPAIVQQFQVKPTEADREATYIQANIDATRSAFALDGVEKEPYAGIPRGRTGVPALEEQLTQVPLVDPKQVFQTFEQRQQPRVYYSVPPVLDVDRYTVDDVKRPLVLGVREVDQEDIADRNWSNLHTVYTHGEGVIAAYADRVSQSEANGRMVWAEGIEDAENIFSALPDFEPRIYFGELSPPYSVVGRPDGGNDVELGLGLADAEDVEAEAETDQETTYDGEDGVPVGGLFSKLLYAVKFGEPNFLLSGRVHENSKVLYNRIPRERVEAVAPWLTVDGDPYPAVIDGRVQWILDGYTTSDRYPNAQRESFESMVDDSLQQETGFQTIPTDEINYMRQAVKATVDAYDGTVTIYAWDEDDPILKAWRSAFPGTVQDRDQIPESLMQHLRYPEDLFKVQRFQLAKYHVTEPGAFYQGNDRWEVPEDPQASGSLQPPYRVFTNPAGGDGADDDQSTWSLTSVFVPRGKGNLAAYVAVDSDATSDTYGELQLLELQDANAPGPGIAANEMQQDQAVRDALRDFLVSGATPPIFGNLLTLPVADGLIYIQPVYAQRTGGASAFPILQFVIVRYGSDVGIGRNLVGALTNALGDDGESGPGIDEEEQQPDEPEQGEGGQENGDGGGAGATDTQALLRDIQEAYDAAEQAQRSGNTVRWAQQMERVQELVQQLIDAREAEQEE